MQCPKCRAAMPNGAKYCTECGAKLPVQPDSVPNVPQPAIQEAPAYEAQPVMTEQRPPAQELQPVRDEVVQIFDLFCALGWRVS